MLVQYAPLGEQLYIFLVSKESLKIVIAPGKPEDLWKKIKTVRKQITTGESGGPLTKNLIALYDLLIVPIESELEPDQDHRLHSEPAPFLSAHAGPGQKDRTTARCDI